MRELPPGWVWVRVGDIGEVRLGRQRSPQHHHGDHMRPYLRVANVHEGRIDVSDVLKMNFTPAEYETYKLLPDDVLLNEGQSVELVGRAAIYQGEVPGACFQNTLIRFRAGAAVLPKYALLVFHWYLHSGRFRTIAKWTTTMAHLGAQRFADLTFPLAPRAEQRRIVAEIETQFTRIDAARSALLRARTNLSRYRASVLAKSCRTCEWTPFGQFSAVAGYGTSAKCDSAASGPPVIRIPNIRNGAVCFDDLKYASSKEGLPDDAALRSGDFLVIRTNGSRSLIGRCALVENSPPSQHYFASYLIRFRLTVSAEHQRWVRLTWDSPQVRAQIEAAAATSAGQYNISIPTLRGISVPVPPNDLSECMSDLESRLSVAANEERSIEASLRRLDRLRQAILKRAFQGHRVPQEREGAPAVRLGRPSEKQSRVIGKRGNR